ncbi:MAG: diiron oxygenase [Isosphaeraceae bacterium]|nr:diiron oxygenase [Isosphaeraceae bacterium]
MSVGVRPVVRKLQNWDAKASVRVKPRRMLLDEEAIGRVYFSPELVPIAQHPEVVALGPEAVRAMQVQHLYRYLDFTTQLELEVVNSACRDIALGKIRAAFPDVMREDAFKLCTDEAHHAYFSDDMKRQVAGATGIRPAELETPRFLERLRALQDELPIGLRPMAELLFTVVSETLISSILCQIPKDKRVVSAVRHIVADHAEDEGRHSAYFAQLFGYLWPQLSAYEQALLGPQLPHYVLAFLSPDHAAIRRSLESLPLERPAIERIIGQTYPTPKVLASARAAALVTIRLFEYHGLMDKHQFRDEFSRLRLL